MTAGLTSECVCYRCCALISTAAPSLAPSCANHVPRRPSHAKERERNACMHVHYLLIRLAV